MFAGYTNFIFKNTITKKRYLIWYGLNKKFKRLTMIVSFSITIPHTWIFSHLSPTPTPLYLFLSKISLRMSLKYISQKHYEVPLHIKISFCLIICKYIWFPLTLLGMGGPFQPPPPWKQLNTLNFAYDKYFLKLDDFLS